MRQDLADLFRATLASISLERVLPAHVHWDGEALHVGGERIRLGDHRRVRVIAVGKAAFSMVGALARIVDPARLEGVAVGATMQDAMPPGIEPIVGGHPHPTPESLRAADAVFATVDPLGEDDLALFLLSGGGSALLERPASDRISLDDCRALHETLVGCGGDIVRMNLVRKHVSAIKGGRLALRAAPARQVTLFVSDVPPGHPSAVASGPTMPDASTVADRRAAFASLGIERAVPDSIRAAFADATVPETPKPGDPAFARCSWHCLLDNDDALTSLQRLAHARGWLTSIDRSIDELPVADAALRLVARLDDLAAAHPGRTVAVLAGGEVACPVTGSGTGGRNQALVLHAAQAVAGRRIAVLSAGTDGIDGNSPAAGAVADGTTLERAAAAGLRAKDHGERSDAHAFFAALGDTVETGPTGNNVRDVRILVACP